MSFVNTSETMGGDSAVLDALIAHSLAAFADDTIVTLGQNAFYKNTGLTSVELPSLTTCGSNAFYSCTALTSASFANLATLGQYMFRDCAALTSVSFPSLTTTAQYAFQNCKSLNSVDLSAVTSVSNYAFENSGFGKLELPACTSLGTYTGKGYRTSVVDLTNNIQIAANKFNGANSLTHLILRSATMCTCGATSAFTGTPIASGKGWVYVPTDLVSTYKAASNWSTYANQIVAISEYPKQLPDETISDTWAQIFAAENDGTYSTKYSVGDTKAVDIGGTSVIMQIAAFDTDTLAGGGTAKITWIATQILDAWWMNPTNTTSGGWADCDARRWLRNIIYPQIESTVRAQIKEVTKTYRTKSPSDTTLSVTDTVWIPSYKEVGFTDSSYVENAGVVYSGIFSDNASRIRKYGIAGSASVWWLRSANNALNFRSVSGGGSEVISNASSSYGLVLGFCT